MLVLERVYRVDVVVLAHGDVDGPVDRSGLVLVWGHLVVARLDGDPEPPCLGFDLGHVVQDRVVDGAEVVVFELLALGRLCAQDGTARHLEVRSAFAVVALIEEVLLLASPAVAGDRRSMTPPAPIPEGEAARPLLARWLEAGSQREAAWGAWEAGERGLTDLAPLVATRLAHEGRLAPKARSTALELVLIDAAIRLKVYLPASMLAASGWGSAEVATWLCLWPVGREHTEGFEALDQGWSEGSCAWYAVGGRLFEARVPAFAMRVMGEWTLERMLRVWDRDGPYPPWRKSGDSLPGDLIRRLPDDFPPIPQRHLSLTRYDGCTPLVGGPFPVYGARSVIRGKRIGWGDVSGSRPKPDEARHGWLAGWLEGAEVPSLPPWAVVNVKWTGGRQPWSRKTRAAIRAIHEDWRSWRDALLERGLLTRFMCRDLAPRIRWEIRDERSMRKRSIPPVPDEPFEVRARAPRRGDR